MQVQALFFDVGNTLLFPNRPRILGSLHERGVFPSEELLQRIERETKCKFDSLVESHASIDHGFWDLYYSRLLTELDITQQDIHQDLVSRTRVSRNWCDVRQGTRDVLLRLGQRYRLGVISNADGKIAEILDHCGIADCFESIIDSGIVGAEKPDPHIFRAALNSLGVHPEESLYVGDVYFGRLPWGHSSRNAFGAFRCGWYVPGTWLATSRVIAGTGGAAPALLNPKTLPRGFARTAHFLSNGPSIAMQAGKYP